MCGDGKERREKRREGGGGEEKEKERDWNDDEFPLSA